jgi:hypothetical protein
MNTFESEGSGINGRASGPLFDAGYILAPGAMAFGTIGEAVQNEVQEQAVDGLDTIESTSTIGAILETVGNMPLDAKAVGLGCAAAAGVMFAHYGRTVRDISVENSIIAAGLDRESAVEPRGRRFLKRTGATALAAVAAYGAYKTGEHMPVEATLGASIGLIGSGLSYAAIVRKRMTGTY